MHVMKYAPCVPSRTAVLGLLLPQLVKCQALLGHELLPQTCLRLLSLPPGDAPSEERFQARVTMGNALLKLRCSDLYGHMHLIDIYKDRACLTNVPH